jgi:hypothetical protein
VALGRGALALGRRVLALGRAVLALTVMRGWGEPLARRNACSATFHGYGNERSDFGSVEGSRRRRIANRDGGNPTYSASLRQLPWRNR